MHDFKRRRRVRGGLVAILAAVLSLGLVSGASAQAPGEAECDQSTGRGVPTGRISIQEWTFAEYIGFGSDAATQARLEEVIEFLSDTGYRNVELFTLSGLTAEEMRELLDEYGIRASSRHVDVGTPESPADIEQILEDNQTLGIRYFGSGSTPIFPLAYSTEAEWVAYAEYLDELGAQARRQGQRLMVHNHHLEFETTFGDKSVFDILVEHTDRRNVYFQVDFYWAVRGLGVANGLTDIGAATDLAVDLIESLGNRVRLAHVKDMSTTIPAEGEAVFPGRIEIVGEGGIDFPTLFDATSSRLRYYVVEHDPRFEDPTFDPFDAAEAGFEYLTCVRY